MKIIRTPIESWDESRLANTLTQFKNARVLIVGDVGVDRYTRGEVERISPEAPVPIVAVVEEHHKLGLAANVADNLRAMGGSARLLGVVGRDRTAEDLMKLLAEAGISSQHLVTDSSRRTGLKERIVSGQQQLLRVDYESLHSLDADTESAVLEKTLSLLDQVDAVVLQDYHKGLLTHRVIQGVIAGCKKHGKMVLVDGHRATPLRDYLGADLLKPNKKEAELLTGIRIHSDEDLFKCGKILLETTQARRVIITLGRDGMAVFEKGSDQVLLIPTYTREVFDVSGAGDTVIAVLALAAAVGADISDSVVLANLAAGVVVGKWGTATCSSEEVLQALRWFREQA